MKKRGDRREEELMGKKSVRRRARVDEKRQGCGSGSVSGFNLVSGSRREKMTHKSRNFFLNFMF